MLISAAKQYLSKQSNFQQCPLYHGKLFRKEKKGRIQIYRSDALWEETLKARILII
jgi:hypothetical protein